jgi:hypothetical protein
VLLVNVGRVHGYQRHRCTGCRGDHRRGCALLHLHAAVIQRGIQLGQGGLQIATVLINYLHPAGQVGKLFQVLYT